jgi:hypothetical protein
MGTLWASLLPLILGGALVPVHLVITILLLRSPGGRGPAVAFVAGLTTVRLVQGAVFGLVLQGADDGDAGSGGPSPFAAGLMLAVGLLLLVAAGRKFLTDDDLDAAPPKWVATMESMTAPKAFAVGAGLLLIGAKFWVLTLGAITAIGDADVSRGTGIATYLVFVALTQAPLLAVLGIAFALPARSAVLLAGASAALQRHNRVIVIVLGVVFGVWFVSKGLSALGVL